MRRPFATLTFTLAAALAPGALFAQAQPPTGQQPAAAAAPAGAPKVGFTTPAGILLVQIKPDQTAVFEEMIGKLKAGLAKATDPMLKQQAGSLKVYKAAEPFGANALYVITMDPAAPGGEY